MKIDFFVCIMKNSKKVLTLKIIPVILTICFLFSDISYGINIPGKSHLRTPLLGNSAEGTNRERTAVDEVSEVIPEDLVEIPQRSFKLKPEREMEERHAEQRASIEIQKYINNFIAELSVIISDYKNAKTDKEKLSIAERGGMLLEEMRALYINMPVRIRTGKTYRFYAELLKELKKRRDAIYEKIEQADKDGNKKALAESNLEAIRNNRVLLKMQLLIAGMLLSGKSTLKGGGIGRYAALATLQGALNSAKRLEDELSFRIKRLRGKKKIQEFETTDWVGQLVRTFRLGGFDIEVGEVKEGAEPSITVRQQKWINVKSRLISIQRNIKKGEIKKAIDALDVLIKLYNVYYIVTMESYKDTATDLKAIRELVLGLPEAQAPPKEQFEIISNKIITLAKKITHPKHRIWVDIEYKSLEKRFHGELKTIASYEVEYMLILGNKAILEYYVEKLKTASQKRYLSKRSRDVIKDKIGRLFKWVDEGWVYPKQFSAIDLRPIISLLDNDAFGEAEQFCIKTIKELETRLKEIDRIVANVKRSAASTYTEYRDNDITKRANNIISALNAEDFELAISHITDLREFYFNQELVEPGYIRAEKLLRNATSIVRGIGRSRNKDLTIKRITSILNELKQDIAHKHSFKITVTREDGKSRKFFINPGTTALGLLNLKNLQRDPDTTLVSIGKGWIPKQNLDKVKLREGAQVLLKPKSISDFDIKAPRSRL